MPVIESVDSPRGEEETRMQSGLGSVPSNDVRVGARGLCSVAVQRGSGPRPPLRFHGPIACAALCQGSVVSTAASRDCRNPPLPCPGVLTRRLERSVFRMGALA